MVAVKRQPIVPYQSPFARFGKYVLLAYWVLSIVIYLTVDLFLDLYTTTDFITTFWYSAVISLPLAALTVYYIRKDLLNKWYTYIIYPVLIYGMYLGCSYFNALNLDLMLSAAIKPSTQQILPVRNVRQVIARKAGFIHTDVTLLYQGKAIVFQGTRTGYFLLIGKKEVQANVGRSYMGNYYITHLKVPAEERWLARGAYASNWFHRHLWLLVGLPLLFILGLFKDKFFPKPASDSRLATHPYRKFFDILLIIILSAIGLIILVLLLAYFLL